jgi:predicted DNA-binding protein
MTLRLDAGTLRRLDHLAAMTERSKAWLAAQAIRDYLELNEWQTRTIELAVKKLTSVEPSLSITRRLTLGSPLGEHQARASRRGENSLAEYGG